MIAGANQREYVIKRPQATESNWRYRPEAEIRAAAKQPFEFAQVSNRLRADSERVHVTTVDA